MLSLHVYCSRAVTRGFEMRALDGVSTRSLAGFGCESLWRGPLRLDSRMGTVQGIYPWVSTLVMGNLMGRRFWVGRGCFFLGGAGEGKRNSRARAVETFSQDDASSKQPWVYVIYYILSSGGFAAACARQSRTVTPILDTLDRHVRCSSFDNPST